MSDIKKQIAKQFSIWSKDTAYEIGSSLTCNECEALAKVFLLVGKSNLAGALIYGHAGGDEDPATISETDDRHSHLHDEDRAAEFAKTLMPVGEEPKQRIATAIRKLYPAATRYGVSSSDQDHYGYVLTDIAFKDGSIINHDSDTFAKLADSIDDELGDLSWGSFGDGNRDSAFDVDITTGQIIK